MLRERVHGVVAVDRATAILAALGAANGGTLALAELARATELHKSTVLRLLVSLRRANLVLRLPDGEYQLGPALRRLGEVFERSYGLEKCGLPIARRIGERCCATVTLSARQGTMRVPLLRVGYPEPLNYPTYVGVAAPLSNGSATAWVLREFEHGARSNAGALRSLPVRIVSTLDRAALGAMAMPIFGAGDQLIGAITISGRRALFRQPELRACARLLVDGACELTALFGGEEAVLRRR